jgi:hypothetical protein
MPPTDTKCPAFASERGDSGGMSAHAAQWAAGSRSAALSATPTMISAIFMGLLPTSERLGPPRVGPA